jgi:hypothetical protein
MFVIAALRPRFGALLFRALQGAFLLACGCRPTPLQEAPVRALDSGVPKPSISRAFEGPPESKPITAAHTNILPLQRGKTYQVEEASLFKPVIPARIQEPVVGSMSVTLPEGFVQLDDQSPRFVTTARKLTSLIDEDEEIAPGRHFLSAYQMLGDRVLIDARLFHVDARSRAALPSGAALPESMQVWGQSESCRLLFPVATVNGEAARSLQLLAVPYVPSASNSVVEGQLPQSGPSLTMRYEVSSTDFLARGEFALGTAALLSNAPSGDLTISYTCVAEGSVIGSGRRIVTLNPELTGGAP